MLFPQIFRPFADENKIYQEKKVISLCFGRIQHPVNSYTATYKAASCKAW